MDDRFAALLTTYRLRRGLSQNALARAVGVSPSTVNNLESGQRHPTRELALQLAATLDLSETEADELLVAARHSPPIFDRLSPADPDLRIALRFLAGDGVPESKRQHFRQLLRGLAGLTASAPPAEPPGREA